MKNRRKTNQELCEEFRHILTHGFHIEGDLACSDLMDSEAQRDEVLRATKPWRNELWLAFTVLERRLCPKPGDRFND